MRKKIIVALSVIACVLCLSALVACNPTEPDPMPGPDLTEHTHEYVPTVTDAQCFAQGYTTYACSCGASYIDDYTPALGHNIVGDKCTRCGHEATQGLTYESVTGGYAVTGIGSATAADLIIPSTYGGSAVVAIADNAFKYVDFIEYVALPESVKVIGREAFYGCDNLQGVALTAVEEICTLALSSENIKQIELPETLKIIRDTAFGQLVMDEIKIPASVELIEECALAFCEFNKITVEAGNARYKAEGNCLIDTQTQAIIAGCKGSIIPTDGSVVKIADNAFRGLLGLDELVIPDSITEIGLWAFSFSEIKSLKLGKGVNTITYGAFQGCEELVAVTVDPENEKYMSAGNCIIEKSKKRVALGCKGSVIPTDANIVTSIAAYAFRECPLPSSFVIPSNVTSIGTGAFAYSGLESVTISGDLTEADGAFSSCTSLKNVTIADGVTKIADQMFRNSGIEHISLPESITEIGAKAFSLSALTEITIPSKVTEIPESAFSTCSCLTQLVIPDTVKIIGERAFENCYNLVKITLGRNVERIDSYAFSGCYKLTELVNLSNLEIEKTTKSDATNFGDIGYSVANTKIRSIACCYAGEIYTSTDYTSKLDFVDGFVFYNNGGSWELYGCNILGDAVLPTSYKGNDYVVAGGAFSYSPVTGITINSGVSKLSTLSIFSAIDLKKIDINGVDTVEMQAIYYCGKLTSLKMSNCNVVEYYAAYDCGTLEELVIENIGELQYLSVYAATFDNLTKLTVSGTDLVASAFVNITNSNAVVILYADIENIADWAFNNACQFDAVYYTGSREQYLNSGYGYVGAFEVYCYSESKPTGEGNYWHYDADGVTPVKW